MIFGVLVNGQFGLCKCKGMCVSCLWSFMTFGPHASEAQVQENGVWHPGLSSRVASHGHQSETIQF